jgi:hypothetical protein
MTAAYWACAGVTTISALTSAGFSVAALRPTGEPRVPAMYGVSRSLALVVVSVVALVADTRGWLLCAALAMVIVQAIDALIGGVQRDTMKTVGPASLAAVNLASLLWLASE